MAQTRGRPERYPADYQHKPCPGCGGAVERRLGERMSDWVARQCCSMSCAGRVSMMASVQAARKKLAAAVAAHPPCTECHRPVPHRKGESLADYETRKICGPACRKTYMSKMMRERAKASPPTFTPAPDSQWEAPGMVFVGNFGAHDLGDIPEVGRAPARPPSRTYGGVAHYGR